MKTCPPFEIGSVLKHLPKTINIVIKKYDIQLAQGYILSKAGGTNTIAHNYKFLFEKGTNSYVSFKGLTKDFESLRTN